MDGAGVGVCLFEAVGVAAGAMGCEVVPVGAGELLAPSPAVGIGSMFVGRDCDGGAPAGGGTQLVGW